MRKRIMVFTMLMIFLLSCFYGSAKDILPEEDKLVGVWLTTNVYDDEIEIYKEEGEYFGKAFVRPGKKVRLDVNNPDKSLRNRPLTNVIILKSFKYKGKNRWGSGTVYDPDNGKTYSCNITMKSNDKIKIRGFIGISLFGRTEKWTRVSTETE